MRFAVRPDDAVDAGILVVGLDVEVAAVAPVFLSIGKGLGDAVVQPLPDESPLDARQAVEGGEVVRETPVAVAHGVGIFAHDEGAGVVLDLGPPFQHFDGGIHGRNEIGQERIGRRFVPPDIRPPDQSPFVVDQPRGVPEAQIARHGGVIGPRPRFVPEAPGIDAGVVLISLEHPRRPVDESPRPLGIPAEIVVEAVMLQIGLVDDVEPVFVAEIVELRRRGVVAGADRVDVEALHGDDVQLQRFIRDRFPEIGVVFVTVDAGDPHRLTVDKKLTVSDLVAAEPRPDRRRVEDASFLVLQFDRQRVKVRRFRAPGEDAGQFRMGEIPDP